MVKSFDKLDKFERSDTNLVDKSNDGKKIQMGSSDCVSFRPWFFITMENLFRIFFMINHLTIQTLHIANSIYYCPKLYNTWSGIVKLYQMYYPKLLKNLTLLGQFETIYDLTNWPEEKDRNLNI